MNTSPSYQADRTLKDFARRLGSSRNGQILAAVAVAAVFIGLFIIATNFPDLSAFVLSIGLLLYGFRLAERILPISASTRARWEREKQIAEDHPAYPHRNFLWTSLVLLIEHLWKHRHDPFNFDDCTYPGVLIVLGSICYLLCIRYVGEEQTAMLDRSRPNPQRFVSLLVIGVLSFCACFQTAIADGGDGQPASAEAKPDKSRYNLFNPVPAGQLREFNPDRPDQTTGPSTVDAGHAYLELDFANYTRDRHTAGGDPQMDQWNVAPLNLRVGLLPSVEADLMYDGYFNLRTREQDSRQTSTKSGVGDLGLRFKINVFGNDKGDIAFGLFPSLRFPTSSAGLASHSVEGGLGLAFSAKLPAGFSLTASADFQFIRNSTDSYYMADYLDGISISHDLGIKDLSAFVEFFSEVSSESPSPVSGQVDVGVIYQIGKNMEIDLDCNFGVTRAAPDYVPFAGLAVRF